MIVSFSQRIGGKKHIWEGKILSSEYVKLEMSVWKWQAGGVENSCYLHG